MKQAEREQEINQTYAMLHVRADLLYSFVDVYNDYIYEGRDYDGSGRKIKMMEVHTLTMINDTPGTTVSELAALWRRTKSAVSQNVTQLEKRGFVRREQDKKNAKTYHLFVTPEGHQLAITHKQYDIRDILETQRSLLQSCSIEEINAFYKVLESFYRLFE